MATKSKATRGGEYVCKVGNFDIRHKIVTPKKVRNFKGEITLVISPITTKNINFLNDDDKKKIKKLIKKSSIKDIINIISKNKKISKKEIYDFCLKLKNET